MSADTPSILVALIHYQTPDLLSQAVLSFRSVYPNQRVHIVDNGSSDGSAHVVEELARADAQVSIEFLGRNTFHGPAMDYVLKAATEDLVFFLDTDTITRKHGFLEGMAELVARPCVLAAGHVVVVDKRGFVSERGTPVPASAYMMVHRGRYLQLPPFVHHGLPVLFTCVEAARRGLTIETYPVETCIDHLGRGTAERFGYGLGLKSRISYLLHRLGF